VDTKEQFLTEFARIAGQIARQKDPSYGANVMPYLEMYARLSSPQERRGFQDALESWLESADAATRQKAVTICLGFFVFRDEIGR